MGTRKALGGGPGVNVAELFRKHLARPLYVVHCSAHRLQLCVSDAYAKDEYLKELEKRVHSLFKHIQHQPVAAIDLIFWSDVAGEDFVGSLGTAWARWLSLLAPLEKIQKSYVTLMCHLHYQFMHHAPRESQKTVQWIFLFMCDWEFRLTLATVIDVLRICMAAKNSLEKDLTPIEAQNSMAKLRARLHDYCEKNSVLAGAMAACIGCLKGCKRAHGLTG